VLVEHPLVERGLRLGKGEVGPLLHVVHGLPEGPEHLAVGLVYPPLPGRVDVRMPDRPHRQVLRLESLHGHEALVYLDREPGRKRPVRGKDRARDQERNSGRNKTLAQFFHFNSSLPRIPEKARRRATTRTV